MSILSEPIIRSQNFMCLRSSWKCTINYLCVFLLHFFHYDNVLIHYVEMDFTWAPWRLRSPETSLFFPCISQPRTKETYKTRKAMHWSVEFCRHDVITTHIICVGYHINGSSEWLVVPKLWICSLWRHDVESLCERHFNHIWIYCCCSYCM